MTPQPTHDELDKARARLAAVDPQLRPAAVAGHLIGVIDILASPHLSDDHAAWAIATGRAMWQALQEHFAEGTRRAAR